MRRSDAGLAPSLPTAGMMNMRMVVVLVMMVFVVIMMMIIRIMMIILLEQELVAEDKSKPPPHFEENKLKILLIAYSCLSLLFCYLFLTYLLYDLL